MQNIGYLFYVSTITTIVWFIIGAILYMNPVVAKIYKKYQKHPSMKKWSGQRSYLLGVFFYSGLIPIFLFSVVYQLLPGMSFVGFGFLLSAIHIIPKTMDNYVQTSYPDTLLKIEVINGIISSFIIAYMFGIL